MEPLCRATESLPDRLLVEMSVDLQEVTGLLHDAHYCGQDFVLHRIAYTELFAMATHFARFFQDIENQSVPVCLAAEDRGVVAAAILAAFATGTILALPHSFSARALQEMQELTGFTTAIIDGRQDLPDSVVPLLPGRDEKGEELSFAAASVEADLLCLFTGGSTGAPKIWVKTAGNLFSEAIFMTKQYRINQHDIIAATISPCHIYGLLFSVLIPLVASAGVLADTPLFPAEIAERVQKEHVTVFVSVPAHYRALHNRKISQSLRIAFSSAGMLKEEDNEAFYRQNNVPVVEVYGSTETGGLATRNRFAGEENYTPLSLLNWHIQEERLYVQSPFISPDVSVDRDGFFLSGDRVQPCGRNSFSLHGRADAVTKVAGERVDLDEVRDVLLKQAGIQDCVVLALPDDTGRGNRIAALVQGESLSMESIKKTLAASLETAAVPRIVQGISEIPTTASGKYNREAILRLFNAG